MNTISKQSVHLGILVVLTIMISNFLPFLAHVCFGQDSNEIQRKIDSLSVVKKSLQMRIAVIDSEIAKFNELKRCIFESGGGKKDETKTLTDALIREKPTANSVIISTAPKNTVVLLLDFIGNEYWKIECDGHVGYMNEMYLDLNNSLKEHFKVNGKKRQYEKEKIAEAKRRLQEKRRKLIGKYGPVVADKIMAKEIWLGMTDEIAKESWGEPNKINRTVGIWGIHEQWIYDKSYLYFENGKLTAWQN